MTEKIRSISISGSGSGANLISGPISSSPSSVVNGATFLVTNTSVIGSSGSGGVNTFTGTIANSNENELDSGGHNNDLIAIASGGGGYDSNSIMNSSQISTASNDSVTISKANKNRTHNIVRSSCRFPKLEECAHFHYERVQLGPLSVRLADEKSDLLNNSIASQSICGDVATSTTITSQQHQQQHISLIGRGFQPQSCSFIIKVTPSRSDSFLIKRSFDNVRMLDEMLHRCVYDRKISGLKNLSEQEFKCEDDVEYAVAKYLERFSKIASDSLTCGTILTWFQLDNKGRRLPLADTETMKSINTPAVGAAYGVRRYVAQACDEISIEVGDMISVIDMPSPAESVWWRGKKSHQQKSHHYEVGFFPQSCVATIGDKVPRHFPMPAPLVGQVDISPTKPVLRKHGKLIAFFRSFILSRPSRRRLKQTGIYRERVFSCDLSEHLLNSGQEIPMVLKCCAEFIEENGIVDGIYRLSGITSNIQKLRRAFDEERIPDLTHPEIRQDIHAVSSLLKMYFRELPNPLCTYQLYDNFVEAIQTKTDSNERLRLMKETVLKLPPPHYRTLKYLATHLSKISKHSANTGMTDKNLAIVWAPNLLRSPALESGGVAALRGVGVQAVVTEYLIKNCNLIFDPSDDYRAVPNYELRMDSLTDCESLLIEQREHDTSFSMIERPKSLSVGGAKLISLEEAQERHSRADNYDMNKSIPINAPAPNVGSYIEVGGGPSSLPDKYHTVLPVPRSWQKRKTHSWKSLFTRNPRNSNSNNDMKCLNVSSPIQKEVEITIPYSGSETNVIDKSLSTISSIQSQQKPKSIDLFDSSKPMEVCVRSNSIDSLRTAGHSRSVSHDSYFDLLQSPLRGVATCPSRELSELGLNFDREEPEMRIFSESESLVSSPKVGKENIPPSRRILRARPEEFSSTTNSVNPSPKKQPRLNLLSPSDGLGINTTWSAISEGNNNADESCCKRYKLEDQLSDIQFIDCSTPEHTIQNSAQNATTVVYASVQVHNPPASLSSKGSSFSDENDKLKKTSFEAIFEDNADHQSENTHARYSYPVLQLAGKRKENDAALKERFSYPGSKNNNNGNAVNCGNNGNNTGKYVCRMPPSNINDKINIKEEGKKDDCEHHRKSFSQKSDISKPKNRYSYCDPSSITGGDVTTFTNFSILRSNSVDMTNKFQQQLNQPQQQKDLGRSSKLSIVTPSSPIQSPHYSLLVGETSSENSSDINTPIYEMDTKDFSDSHHHHHHNNAMTSDDDCCSSSNNNLTSQLSPHNTQTTTTTTTTNTANDIKRDITALKRELSLDLNGCGGTKMSVDLIDLQTSNNTKQYQQQLQPNNCLIPSLSSPNNSNFTHNTSDLDTSQSITPSEFGYQHLNRQSMENSPSNFDGYDNLEAAFINYEQKSSTSSLSAPTACLIGTSPASVTTNTASPTDCHSPMKQKASSPIKATISITYNLKSPVHKKNANDCDKQLISPPNGDDYENITIMDTEHVQRRENQQQQQQMTKPLLETNFDENMVYEQVKFFRTSVSEVNKLLNNGNNEMQSEQQQIVPQLSAVSKEENCNNNLILLDDLTPTTTTATDTTTITKLDADFHQSQHQQTHDFDDILMTDNIDSLEMEQNYSLYENVELRKPPIHYENIEINSKNSSGTASTGATVVGTTIKSSSRVLEKQKSLENNQTSQGNTLEKQLQQQKRSSDATMSITKSPTTTSLSSSPLSTTNFSSVKQLATKFETSPIEQMPPFDFSQNYRGSKKFNNDLNDSSSSVANRDAPCYVRAKNHANKHQNLNRSTQITRSLDENAFVREFGSINGGNNVVGKQKLPPMEEDIAKSVQQIHEKILNENNDIRRKSFEFNTSRPKSLNPPKKLPNIDDSNNSLELCRKASGLAKLHLDLRKTHENDNDTYSSSGDIKITPTTENRISLIQNNVVDSKLYDDECASGNNSSSSSSTSSTNKVLSGVKLNRERIEQIKEERRHQLSEKYRTESFKSKSKTELRELPPKDEKYQSESLRIKSRSRGDVRSLQQQIQQRQDHSNDRDTDIIQFSNTRVRRISDEKNQNNSINFDSTTTTTTTNNEEFSTKQAVQKFERKSLDFPTTRERGDTNEICRSGTTRNSISSTREKISPQFSIRDVTAMFESRSQNQ